MAETYNITYKPMDKRPPAEEYFTYDKRVSPKVETVCFPPTRITQLIFSSLSVFRSLSLSRPISVSLPDDSSPSITSNYVLGMSKGIEETGNIKISLALCLLVAWIIVFFCLCKGVQSSGKVISTSRVAFSFSRALQYSHSKAQV